MAEGDVNISVDVIPVATELIRMARSGFELATELARTQPQAVGKFLEWLVKDIERFRKLVRLDDDESKRVAAELSDVLRASA